MGGFCYEEKSNCSFIDCGNDDCPYGVRRSEGDPGYNSGTHSTGTGSGRSDVRIKGREGTDSVIMPVAHDHAAVESVISCLSGGDNLNLRREKVLLLNIVFLLQKIQDLRLYALLCIFFLILFVCGNRSVCSSFYQKKPGLYRPMSLS